jgi:tight adherence protein B
MVIALVSFLVVFAAFLATYWVMELRPERNAERALERRLQPMKRLRAAARIALMKRIQPISSIPALQKLLAKVSFTRDLERLLERSGLTVTVGQLVLTMFFLAVLGFFVSLWTMGSTFVSIGVAVAGGMLPLAVVRFAAKRRIIKFEEYFPEAIDLIARAMRAGHAFTTGLGMVADEVPDPVRSEFRLLYDRQNFGMPLGDAMRSFAERVPLLDARFFVTAVLTQRESGGNLSEVLDSLAALIRDRFRLRRQVRTLSAHGRITGWVLGCLPFAIGGILFLVSPEYISVLFTDPLGQRMVATAGVLQVFGFYVMGRIVNIEI